MQKAGFSAIGTADKRAGKVTKGKKNPQAAGFF